MRQHCDRLSKGLLILANLARIVTLCLELLETLLLLVSLVGVGSIVFNIAVQGACLDLKLLKDGGIFHYFKF